MGIEGSAEEHRTRAVSAAINDVKAEVPEWLRAFGAELDFVYRLLRRFGVRSVDSDDLAQEVFLVVWRCWRDYDPHRPLRPWLAGITFRVARDHQRRVRREVPRGFVEGEEPLSPFDHLDSARARALVRRALASLPERQRTILILHELEGFRIPEVAEAMRLPATTLYSRLKKAQATFRRSVRRLQLAAPSSALLPDVEVALAIERAPRPKRPDRRAMMARLSALASQGRPPVFADARPPARRWPLPLAAALIALAMGAALVVERPGARHASSHASSILRPPAPASAGRLAEGLVGYWRFDDGASSARARDASGSGTDCLIRGMDPRSSWTGGRMGGALALDGLGWLACDEPRFVAAGAAGTELSVALWIRRTEVQPGYHAVVTRQSGAGALDHFFVGFRGDDILVTSHVWGGKLYHAAPPVGRWFHLAMVYGRGEVALFIDGARVARAATRNSDAVAGDTAITVGGGVNGPDPRVASQRFVGLVDELVVYRRSLSPDEVKALAGGIQPTPAR